MSAIYTILALIGIALYTTAMVQLAFLILRVWQHVAGPKDPDGLA